MFTFHIENKMIVDGVALALHKVLGEQRVAPVVVCIGSDLSVGDSLGPLVGTMLKRSDLARQLTVYGTLSAPITANEVGYLNSFLRKTHPHNRVLVIDAAVGSVHDIAKVKVQSQGIFPGSGANKRLACVGDASIIGIVAEKTAFQAAMGCATRLNLVYRMAQAISDGIYACLNGMFVDDGQRVGAAVGSFQSLSANDRFLRFQK